MEPIDQSSSEVYDHGDKGSKVEFFHSVDREEDGEIPGFYFKAGDLPYP